MKTIDDICHHSLPCDCKEWMYATVPDYYTYIKASKWLRDIRNHTFISVDGVFKDGGHTGAYRFKFLCKQEYVWFMLRWT